MKSRDKLTEVGGAREGSPPTTSGSDPAVNERAPGRYTEGNAIGERYLPEHGGRELALGDEVALVNGREDSAHNKSGEEGAPKHRPEKKRAPEAAKVGL